MDERSALANDDGAEVPYARSFVDLSTAMGARGNAPSSAKRVTERFRNDHVAFRSLARPGGGIAIFERAFAPLGWRRGGEYEFPDVHLRAVHLSHPEGGPRVFVSELVAERLPESARRILHALPRDPEPPSAADEEALADWFAPPDVAPSREDLAAVESVSQYGAWLLAFGRKVNHFTASVDDVESWQRRLVAAGVPMKSEIEGAPDSPLRQTATGAAPLTVALRDGGTVERPYAYFEIAQREAGFDGFLGPQARQLFEMTSKAR